MTKRLHTRLSSLALAALLTATPVLAQEAAAPEQPSEPATAEATEGGSGDGLNMGTPVGENASQVDAIGSTYIEDVSGDWEIHCVRTQLDADPCALHQMLRDESDNPVATIEMVNLPAGRQAVAGATIVTPLETLLTEQITLSVDGNGGRAYPFNFCTQRGCVSRVGFAQADVDRFKRGNAAQLSIVPMVAPDQKVALTISLNGFTAGFDKIKELNAANEAAVAKATAEAPAATPAESAN
jgi:invasion protein IalB